MAILTDRKTLSEYDAKATGIRYTGEQIRLDSIAKAKVVILSASVCETARILLSSKSKLFPDGLANSSGQVGKNLVDSVGFAGRGEMVPNDDCFCESDPRRVNQWGTPSSASTGNNPTTNSTRSSTCRKPSPRSSPKWAEPPKTPSATPSDRHGMSKTSSLRQKPHPHHHGPRMKLL